MIALYLYIPHGRKVLNVSIISLTLTDEVIFVMRRMETNIEPSIQWQHCKSKTDACWSGGQSNNHPLLYFSVNIAHCFRAFNP